MSTVTKLRPDAVQRSTLRSKHVMLSFTLENHGANGACAVALRAKP